MDALLEMLRDPATVLVIRPHAYGPIVREFLIAERPHAPGGGLVHTGLCMISEAVR